MTLFRSASSPVRYALSFLLTATLLTACSKDTPQSRIIASQESLTLANSVGANGRFKINSNEAWNLTTSGGAFTAEPASGNAGETEITVTATEENAELSRISLGTITFLTNSKRATTSVAVAQSATVVSQTLLMYFPWSGNLTAFFEQNIADMEQIVAGGMLQDERILVFFMKSSEKAEIFELTYDKGASVHKSVKVYDIVPAFTTADGLASILEEVKQAAPAERYAMTIGCHGMGWIPVYPTQRSYRALVLAPEKEYWEHPSDGRPLTRWFGGTSPLYQTDISTLAEGIDAAGIKMEYILLDDCYMSSIEVAYDLRHVTDYLIGSTCEIMAFGFPYALLGHHMIGEVNYAGICDEFNDFYTNYNDPYGTIGITDCSEIENLAAIMKEINGKFNFDSSQLNSLQALDGYNPVRFFDMGDYVKHLCTDGALLDRFNKQLALTVPYFRNTPNYYSALTKRIYPISTFSGITTSDPSTSSATADKVLTSWWNATHAD